MYKTLKTKIFLHFVVFMISSFIVLFSIINYYHGKYVADEIKEEMNISKLSFLDNMKEKKKLLQYTIKSLGQTENLNQLILLNKRNEVESILAKQKVLSGVDFISILNLKGKPLFNSTQFNSINLSKVPIKEMIGKMYSEESLTEYLVIEDRVYYVHCRPYINTTHLGYLVAGIQITNDFLQELSEHTKSDFSVVIKFPQVEDSEKVYLSTFENKLQTTQYNKTAYDVLNVVRDRIPASNDLYGGEGLNISEQKFEELEGSLNNNNFLHTPFVLSQFKELIVMAVLHKSTLKKSQGLQRYFMLFLVVFFISSFFAFILSSTLSSFVSKPVHKILVAIRKVSNGQFNINLPVISRDELGLLASSFNQMAEDLGRRDLELQLYYEQKAKEKEHIDTELATPQVPREEIEFKLYGNYLNHEYSLTNWWNYSCSDKNLLFVFFDLHQLQEKKLSPLIFSINAHLQSLASREGSLSELVKRIRLQLLNSSLKNLELNCFIGNFNFESRELEYINTFDMGAFQNTEEGVGAPLGKTGDRFSMDGEAKINKVSLAKGNKLIIFSSQIASLKNDKGSLMDEKILNRIVKYALRDNLNGKEVNERIKETLNTFDPYFKTNTCANFIVFESN